MVQCGFIERELSSHMVLDRRKKESQLLRRLAARHAQWRQYLHRSGANQEEPGSEAELRREPPGRPATERRNFDGAARARSR
jgi:hypothetical protein